MESTENQQRIETNTDRKAGQHTEKESDERCRQTGHTTLNLQCFTIITARHASWRIGH